MENLSFSNLLDYEAVSLSDDGASEYVGGHLGGHVRRIVSNAPSAYSAVGLLESLSAYAAVFGCSTNCNA